MHRGVTKIATEMEIVSNGQLDALSPSNNTVRSKIRWNKLEVVIVEQGNDMHGTLRGFLLQTCEILLQLFSWYMFS